MAKLDVKCGSLAEGKQPKEHGAFQRHRVPLSPAVSTRYTMTPSIGIHFVFPVSFGKVPTLLGIQDQPLVPSRQSRVQACRQLTPGLA